MGSGYGRACIHAYAQTGLCLCAGVEIAEDRCYTSIWIAKKAGEDGGPRFFAANVEKLRVLPVLRAATHLYSYDAVFSPTTQQYLADFLRDPLSCWLLYISCNTPTTMRDSGVQLHFEPHLPGCRLGGVHVVGKMEVKMAFSGTGHTMFFYVRCVRTSGDTLSECQWTRRQIAARQRGVQTLDLLAKETTLGAAAYWKRLLTEPRTSRSMEKRSTQAAALADPSSHSRLPEKRHRKQASSKPRKRTR